MALSDKELPEIQTPDINATPPPSVGPEVARVILEFMKRVNLQGNEVPAFTQVTQTLGAIALSDQQEKQ